MTESTTARKRWSFFQRARYLIVFKVVPLFVHLYFRYVVNNGEIGNQYSEGQGVIFCSNHQSHLDALLVGGAIATPYGTRKFVAFMGNGKVMKENFIFSTVKWWGGFPVYRKNPKPALDHSVALLKEGICTFMSPQGKRVGTSPVDDYFNLKKDPRSGVGRIVLLTNGKIPVIPIYLHGAGAALGGGRLVPKYKAYISVSFNKPLTFEKYSREEGWSEENPDFFPTAKKIAIEVMDAIHEEMMNHEKSYFKIIERKFGVMINEIDEQFRANRSFRKYQRNLCNYSPEELNQILIESNPK